MKMLIIILIVLFFVSCDENLEKQLDTCAANAAHYRGQLIDLNREYADFLKDTAKLRQRLNEVTQWHQWQTAQHVFTIMWVDHKGNVIIKKEGDSILKIIKRK